MDDKAKGTWDQTKGKAREAWGDATGDTSTQIKGKAEQLKGKAEKGVGDVKERMREDQAEERERTDVNRP